jgi:hypothetical protein
MQSSLLIKGTSTDLVHFKTAINQSFDVLTKKLSVKTPRQLVLKYMETNPNFEKAILDSYVDYYLRARYSEQEFSLSEYKDFLQKFIAISKDE